MQSMQAEQSKPIYTQEPIRAGNASVREQKTQSPKRIYIYKSLPRTKPNLDASLNSDDTAPYCTRPSREEGADGDGGEGVGDDVWCALGTVVATTRGWGIPLRRVVGRSRGRSGIYRRGWCWGWSSCGSRGRSRRRGCCRCDVDAPIVPAHEKAASLYVSSAPEDMLGRKRCDESDEECEKGDGARRAKHSEE